MDRTLIGFLLATLQLAAVAAVASGLVFVPILAAQGQADTPDWKLLAGPGGAVARLWSLPRAAIFAADSEHGLFISRDAGDTWQSVPVPPDGWATTRIRSIR